MFFTLEQMRQIEENQAQAERDRQAKQELVLDFQAYAVANAFDALDRRVPGRGRWVYEQDVREAIAKLLRIAQEPGETGLAFDDLGLLVDRHGNVSIRLGRASFEVVE